MYVYLSLEDTAVYGTFRFLIEIDGIQYGGFSEMSGLDSEIATEDYNEGGVNMYSHKLPTTIRYSNVVLKRGMVDSNALWEWFKRCRSGSIARKGISVILQDLDGEEKKRWYFQNAYPIKWTGPSFNALRSEMAVESLELCHKGFELIV